jgi:hypothetical protein
MNDPTVDPALDSEAIMARIRAAIQERRAMSGLDDAEFDALATGAHIQPTIADLRRDVSRLADAIRYSGVEMILSDVRPSPISGLIQRFRGALHEVILFYVNRLASQQATANRLMLHVLRTTLQLIEAQQMRIEALEQALAQRNDAYSSVPPIETDGEGQL